MRVIYYYYFLELGSECELIITKAYGNNAYGMRVNYFRI